MNSDLPHQYESVTADAGYESEENYVYLENHNQKAYIKPQVYEKSKTRKFKNDISKRENMQYDQESDNYICAYGRRLVPIGTRRRKSKSNYEAKISIYECLDCDNCPYRDKCNKGKGNKKLHVAKTFIEQRLKSLKNITTPEGILLRMNRSIQVEGAFGVLKQDYGFRRFLMRGNKNVKTEFLLLSFGYNINKLHNKRHQKRAGQQLHPKQIA